MLKYFLPSKYVNSIFDVHAVELKEQNVKGIITDLDNTLVAWNVADASPDVSEWFRQMNASGIKVTIISNNDSNRVKTFSDPLDVPFLYSARKPLPRSFKQAATNMQLNTEEIVVIGDQLLTDVLGGNLAGFHTILVTPVAETDGKATIVNRKIERQLLSYMRKKGKISWEE